MHFIMLHVLIRGNILSANVNKLLLQEAEKSQICDFSGCHDAILAVETPYVVLLDAKRSKNDEIAKNRPLQVPTHH